MFFSFYPLRKKYDEMELNPEEDVYMKAIKSVGRQRKSVLELQLVEKGVRVKQICASFDYIWLYCFSICEG